MKILVIQTAHYDFSCASLVSGLHQLKRKGEAVEFYCTERSNYAFIDKKWNYYLSDEKEIIKFGEESDLVILTSNQDVKENYIDKIDCKNKLVYIDGEDKFEYRRDPKDFVAYFKREMRRDQTHQSNVYPFPFAAEERYFTKLNHSGVAQLAERVAVNHHVVGSSPTAGAIEHKPFDICCMFGPHDHMKLWRVDIENALLSMNLKNSNIKRIYGGNNRSEVDSGNRDHENYYRMLYFSKISVDARGAYGCGSARFWESIANGCCTITQKILVFMPNSFEDMKHIVEYESIDELKEKVNWLLENDNERRKIAKAGYEHLCKYHTCDKRAQYLIDKHNSIRN